MIQLFIEFIETNAIIIFYFGHQGRLRLFDQKLTDPNLYINILTSLHLSQRPMFTI